MAKAGDTQPAEQQETALPGLFLRRWNGLLLPLPGRAFRP